MSGTLPLTFEPPSPLRSTAPADSLPAYRYLNRILKLRTAEKRCQALAEIADPDTRAVVRFYVEDHFARLHRRPLPDLARIQMEEGAQTTRSPPCNPSTP